MNQPTSNTVHHVKNRTVWIISFTAVARSPRVIRQAQALAQDGWNVVVFGHDSNAPCPSGWRFVPIPDSAVENTMTLAFLRARRLAGFVLAKFAPDAAIRQWGSKLYYRAIPHYRRIEKLTQAFLKNQPELRPDLVISHDYFTADIGYRVADHSGAKFTVDCHEYARGEYMHDTHWVKRVRPMVVALQDFYLARADGVTTVCDGIAQLLDTEQVLRRPVTVVRSVPFLNPQEFRPTGKRISVLYHGQIYPSRDLDVAVRSMAMWRPEFHLILRGYSDPAYVMELERLARELGVSSRLRIEPPVPFEQIIPCANDADIGIFVHRDNSPQQRFVLPNKFFEYMMAGLALCVSDLPEMARLMNIYKLGVLASSCEENAIAATINGLDREQIDAMKQNSIKAARELNWESEQQRMLGFYEELCR